MVLFSNAPPAIRWSVYSGPGTVTFGDAAQTNTTAVFSAPGSYTLELSANDGVHAVAYDAVVINVINGITVSMLPPAGTNVERGVGSAARALMVQRSETWPATSWSDLVTTSLNSTNLPITNTAAFFPGGRAINARRDAGRRSQPCNLNQLNRNGRTRNFFKPTKQPSAGGKSLRRCINFRFAARNLLRVSWGQGGKQFSKPKRP